MWYLLSTICQDVEEWNMSTKYVSKFAQPCKHVPMVSNSLELRFLLNPFTSLLNVLVWCLTSKSYLWKMRTHIANFHVNQFKTMNISMVGDQLPRWMGYQTNNTNMWPWTKQISNIPLHTNFTWLLFGYWINL